MLNIHYFASIRERLNKETEEIEFSQSVSTVDELIIHLQNIDSATEAAFSSAGKILVAVNQTVVNRDHVLTDNDEIAFFPPMTGG